MSGWPLTTTASRLLGWSLVASTALALTGCGASVNELVVSVAGPGQKPISDATVTVVGTGVAGRTDASGEAHLSPLASGVYTDVKVSAPGYATVRETDISIPFGGSLLVLLERAGQPGRRAHS